MGKSKGRVVIEFADLEDLERIYRRITERANEPENPALIEG